jgi:hypothetical protein
MMDVEGNTSGLNDRLRGQMGVKTRALSEGCTIGPPAEREYAVEPVGVDTMRPSDWCEVRNVTSAGAVKVLTTASVRCCPSTNISIVLR